MFGIIVLELDLAVCLVGNDPVVVEVAERLCGRAGTEDKALAAVIAGDLPGAGRGDAGGGGRFKSPVVVEVEGIAGEIVRFVLVFVPVPGHLPIAARQRLGNIVDGRLVVA